MDVLNLVFSAFSTKNKSGQTKLDTVEAREENLDEPTL